MRLSGNDAHGILNEYTKINESSVANMGSGTPTAVVVPAPGSNAAGGSGIPKGRYPSLISNVGVTGSQASGYEDNEEVSDEESIEMAKGQLLMLADKALTVLQMLQSGKNLEGWTTSKITLAADYIETVADYMEYNKQSDNQSVSSEPVEIYVDDMVSEKKDRCYYAVKARYKVWPSAYASGALAKCRKGKAFKKKK